MCNIAAASAWCRIVLVGTLLLGGAAPVQAEQSAAPQPRSTANDLPTSLTAVAHAIDSTLREADAALAQAATELARTGLRGEPARRVLADLCNRFAFAVNCSAVDARGIMVTVEPPAYRNVEGADISEQAQIIRLHATRRPVLSEVFRAVEGFDAIDFEHPVLTPDGQLLGSVSLLARTGALLGHIIEPQVQGMPVDVWVMQPNAYLLYDPDEEEIGRNVFTDPLYQPYTELLALTRRIAAERSGSGRYEFLGRGLRQPVTKEAYWTTVGLHGREWRVVLTHVVVGEPAAARTSPEQLGLKTAEQALRELARNSALLNALATGDNAAALRMLEAYYREHRGLYAVEWVDPKAVTRFGYPPENSLNNYDLATNPTPSGPSLIAALRSREEANFRAPLVEGKVGRFILVPLFRGADYLGMLYTIRLEQ